MLFGIDLSKLTFGITGLLASLGVDFSQLFKDIGPGFMFSIKNIVDALSGFQLPIAK